MIELHRKEDSRDLFFQQLFVKMHEMLDPTFLQGRSRVVGILQVLQFLYSAGAKPTVQLLAANNGSDLARAVTEFSDSNKKFTPDLHIVRLVNNSGLRVRARGRSITGYGLWSMLDIKPTQQRLTEEQIAILRKVNWQIGETCETEMIRPMENIEIDLEGHFPERDLLPIDGAYKSLLAMIDERLPTAESFVRTLLQFAAGAAIINHYNDRQLPDYMIRLTNRPLDKESIEALERYCKTHNGLSSITTVRSLIKGNNLKATVPTRVREYTNSPAFVYSVMNLKLGQSNLTPEQVSILIRNGWVVDFGNMH